MQINRCSIPITYKQKNIPDTVEGIILLVNVQSALNEEWPRTYNVVHNKQVNAFSKSLKLKALKN